MAWSHDHSALRGEAGKMKEKSRWRELGEKSIKVFLRLIKPNEVTQMMD